MDIIVYLLHNIQKHMTGNNLIIGNKYTPAQKMNGMYMPICCCC